MKRTNVYLEDSQPAKLDELAERTGIVAAEHTRRAVALYLLINAETGSIAAAIQEAQQVFDDADTLERALIRQLIHWHHSREKNSMRGALRRIERHLGIEEPEGPDNV